MKVTPSFFPFEWESKNSVTLKGVCWLPQTPFRAVIVCAHGFGEHTLRYESWAKKFNEKGIAFLGFDWIGHGNSGGLKGHFSSPANILQILGEAIALAANHFPQVPIFLYGHSMGGNLAANFALHYPGAPISGLILSSPWLTLHEELSYMQAFAVRTLAFYLGKIRVKASFDLDGLSSDPEIRKAYEADPLVHNQISLRALNMLRDSGAYVLRQCKKLHYKTLLAHGEKDTITSWKSSKEFAEKTPEGTVTFVSYPEGRHELHNDSMKEEWFLEIVTFIEKTIPSALIENEAHLQ